MFKPSLVALLLSTQLFAGCTLLSVDTKSFRVERVSQQLEQNYSELAARRAREWSNTLAILKSEPEYVKLKVVNEYFNDRLLFSNDVTIWNKKDYWATPIETLTRGMGDCEDYAVAKYFSLKFVGVAPEKLRLAHVQAQIGTRDNPIKISHMVLLYYASPDAEPLVLDNMVGEIRSESQRPDILTLFSFNSSDVRTYRNTPSLTAHLQVKKLSLVFEKMKQEGFRKI